MRKILFRGLDKRGGWHYGFVCQDTNGGWRIKERIAKTHFAAYDVIAETIGQYTGMEDKSNIRIFAGDIVEAPDFWNSGEDGIGVIIFTFGAFAVKCRDESTPMSEWGYEDEIKTHLEIIGNIHQSRIQNITRNHNKQTRKTSQ